MDIEYEIQASRYLICNATGKGQAASRQTIVTLG